MKFTHLHVHTEYSLLDGSNKINEYVARVKELGMDSAAITDHGVMFGCIDFYKAAKAAGMSCVWFHNPDSGDQQIPDAVLEISSWDPSSAEKIMKVSEQ